MPTITIPAVHLNAKAPAGKMPMDGAAAAESAKGDFRQHLAVVKATAKPAAQAPSDRMASVSDAAADGIDPAATEDANKMADKIIATGKTTLPVRSGVKAAAGKTSKARQDAGAAAANQAGSASALVSQQPAALVTAPDNFAASAGGPKPLQAWLAEALEGADQTTPAHAATSRNPDPTPAPIPVTGGAGAAPAGAAPAGAAPADAAQAGAAQTISVTTTGTAANHATALPNPPATGPDIAGQLAGALPAAVARPGANLALHVALTPETLGHITIKIEHNAAGDANVTLTATRPETLESLKKDVANLNQMLTNAGLPEAGRQIDFKVAPVAAPQSGGGLGNAGNSAMQFGSGGQPAPEHGTGFANSFAASAAMGNAAAAIPAQAAMAGAPHYGARRGVDMIA